MKLVCYSIKNLKPVERTKFQRDMYGFKDISNNSKYTYRRTGLLNDSNHEKIFFTGIVVKDSIAEEVIKLLKKHKVKIHVTEIPQKKH